METISSVFGFLAAISIFGIAVSGAVLLLRAVMKKPVKVNMIILASFLGLLALSTIIGTFAYSNTDDYKKHLADKKQQKQAETQNNKTLENESISAEIRVPEEKTNNEESETENTTVEQISIESAEIKITEESIENRIEKDEISNKVQIAIESIGMDYSQVKNWRKLDDWSSGKRYSFVYNGFGYIVYELGNGEIDSINTEYKRTKIYERGYKPLNYKDFEPDISVIDTLQSDMIKRLSSYIIGETSIKSKIGSMMYSRIYDYYSISGEVKAKNAVSKRDFTFTVDYIVKDGGYECVYLALDGAVAFGSDQTPKLPKEELEQENESENGEAIILSYDKEGQCGQFDLFDGEPYLRYYVPVGTYTVKCNIRGGFYIETIELHKEDGWDTSDIIQQINMSEGEETEITIEDGQCISLIINTEIELIKQ